MRLRLTVVIVALIITFGVGCDTNSDDENGNLEFIVEGSHSGNIIKRNNTLTSQLEFEKAYFSDQGNASPPPAIDFSQQIVLAIYLGQQSTGGWSITMANIIETDTSIHILLSIASPGPGCVVTQEITTPYALYSIVTSDKEIIFSENYTSSACI